MIDSILADYTAAANEAVQATLNADQLEIDRASHIAEATEKLLLHDEVSPRTGKKWSWTAAYDYTRDQEEHRKYQRAIAELRASAERFNIDARAHYLKARAAIAMREGLVGV